jgi:hypothetical protein
LRSARPQTLEDADAVDRLRREAGMETLAENTARIAAAYGRCGQAAPPN